MKTLKTGCCYQGDIKLELVDALPGDATEKPASDTRIVVAHSETGHHHWVSRREAAMYATKDPFVCYLKMEGEHLDLIHDRQVNAHETIRIVGKFCKVTRQREYTPDGWRVVQD